MSTLHWNTHFYVMKRNNRRLLAAFSTASAEQGMPRQSGRFKTSTGNYEPGSNDGPGLSSFSPKTLALMKNLPVWPSGETISLPPENTTNAHGGSVPSGAISSFVLAVF